MASLLAGPQRFDSVTLIELCASSVLFDGDLSYTSLLSILLGYENMHSLPFLTPSAPLF
jgi:hypothetical protein